MADRIAVMRAGRVDQVGAPDELYEQPATRFVARFLGDASLFPGRVERGAVGGWRVAARQLEQRGIGEGRAAVVVVRPERLQIGAAGELGELANVARGRVAEVAYLGTARKYVIDLENGGSVQVRAATERERSPFTAGDVVDVGWEAEDGVVVPDDEAAPASEPEPVHA